MSGAPLPTSAFDYELPPGRIAQRPTARRDESRLLVLRRVDGRVEHRRFSDFPALIEPGDVVALNESRVIPARLVGRKPTGGEAEILLVHPATVDGAPPAGLESDPRLWLALVRPGAKLKPGRSVTVAADLVVRVIDSTADGARIVRLETELPVAEALRRHGRVPLPPYISREPTAEDAVRYQTVFARAAGSVAAPTAGLHFTPALLDAIEARGAALARVVLHVGIGTFRPVEAEDPAAHRMHAEWYSVPASAARRIGAVRAAGGRVWAVGTTVVRTLESAANAAGVVEARTGWTDLFIRPPYRFRIVDRLLTNFHLPRSTLLMLVAAFGGHAPVMAAYRQAVEAGYRFYSYGDAMAIV